MRTGTAISIGWYSKSNNRFESELERFTRQTPDPLHLLLGETGCGLTKKFLPLVCGMRTRGNDAGIEGERPNTSRDDARHQSLGKPLHVVNGKLPLRKSSAHSGLEARIDCRNPRITRCTERPKPSSEDPFRLRTLFVRTGHFRSRTRCHDRQVHGSNRTTRPGNQSLPKCQRQLRQRAIPKTCPAMNTHQSHHLRPKTNACRLTVASPALTLATWMTVLSAHAAAIAHDEAVSGDLANAPDAPTSVSLVLGSNEIRGLTGRAVAGGPVDRDFFTFTIPAMQTLTAIHVLPGTAGAGGGGLEFIGAVNGSSFGSTVPTSPSSLLGYHLFGAGDVGSDILGAIGAGGGAMGFTGPLGAGTYAFWVQETAVSSVRYGLDFRVASVPESGPGTMMGLSALGLTLLGRRWCRK